jgi:YVTN family beta-propeller protein
MYFSKRLLKYESTANPTNLDYGEVSQVLTDKLINVNMGGSNYILEAVGVAGSYIPKVGDWVVVEWQNGTPIAKGDSATTAGSGLININTPTIVSPSDMASGTVNSDHIRVNSIEAQHLQAGSVTAYAISANSITASAISANAIQTQHISANTIQGSQIQAGTITTNNIQAGAITGTLISANSITAVQLQANSVTAVQISANAVQTQHISANSIIASQIQAGAITTNAISANSIIASLIQSNAIQTQHISSNSILGYMIQANQISGSHIIANMISANHITANAIGAIHITANAITSVAISSNSIQARHISANSILAGMISANQINATHISANSILSNMISANQIQTQHISANSIQSQQISSNSIQTQHISANTIVGNQIQANQISGNHIVAGTLDASKLTVGTLQQGLLGQYYTYSAGASNKFQTFKGSQIDTTINFNWGTGSPSLVGQNDYYAMRWQGFISAPETGSFQFVVTADEGTTLTVNNSKIINNWDATNGAPVTGNISLTQGSFYPIVLEYFESTGNSNVMLEWIRPSLTRQVIPAQYLTQGNTVIDGSTITTGTITASSMQIGTITAQSGILANAVIQTANIADGIITSAKIGVGEIKTANIASGNITNALIQDATITSAKIVSVDAGTINVGQLNGGLIKANTISGGSIIAQTITGDRLVAGAIDTPQLKAGSVVTNTISAGAITSDRIQAGAITGDLIRAGSITAQHISTIGLDAQIVQVYNGLTGETLVGSGYLRVDGLDVGVVQSDNLLQNGLFLTSSSDYGFKRMNPSGEALLGNTVTGVGSHQVWKIDLTSGSVVKKINIPSKKPFDIGIHPSGNYAYITVQGNDTLAQLDLTQDALTTNTLNMGMGPGRIIWRSMQMAGMDMKHFMVLNTDADSMAIPDSVSIIDTPPSSVNGDLYVHHEIPLGINPYDIVVDSNMMAYITMASEGDIVVIDTTSGETMNWKVKGRIPISAFGTDNNHGDLPSQFGMNEVVGGDASSQYNNNSMGTMTGMGGMDAMNGYSTSDGSLRNYQPHGIALSSDPNTLYVVDYANGELVVVDKYGNAPYNYLVGTTAQGSFGGSQSMGGMTMTSGGMMMGTSPASLKANGEVTGGGPGTYYVRYRIPVGDSPEFIQVVNGKIFITLEGSNSIAVIDESAILNEINSDNTYYGTKNPDGSFSNWNPNMSMRTVNQPTVRMVMGVGIEPSFMKVVGMTLYVSLSGSNQIAIIDTGMEMVTSTINVGTNPKGFDITPDGRYLYIANYGGVGDLSFIYPTGPYIGDPFMALEGGIMYQGADGWTPNRSDWVYDISGNIQSKSVVEFHINEPLKNEGGYAKLTAFGIDTQYSQIEQDIINVENHSNGNNIVTVSGGRLINNLDNTIWIPREGSFISGSVSNIMVGSVVSGSTVLTSANTSQYTVNYGTSQILFSSNAVASGNWVQANYTAPNNIYFKTHNSSLEIAVDNGSSPNFATSFQVDEFVPNFVAVDNRQTSSFTPTADGISTQYEGLYYSTMTNQASNTPSGNITSNLALSGNRAYLTDGITNISGNFLAGTSGNQYVQVDLGNAYMVGQVNVWHYSNNNRKYNGTKTQVSEDGISWTTVFDSAVSGTYVESTSGNIITFNALPTRYIRDYLSGNTTDNTNKWVEIQAFGDWQINYGLTYPSNSTKAGQQIATNGKGFVQTNVSKAYVAYNVPINFTSWWWMTYVVGPQFGRIKIEMPTLMNSGHFLNQQAPFINNVAHRHIMSFPPSMMIQADMMNNIEAGMHRVIIRQDSGTVTLDRIRFDDFQYYNRSTLAIPSQSSPATFTRYKVVAEQAKWYKGQGRQSTEGAYDTPRTNPDTGLPDYSVPIKYRVRVLAQLSPTGNIQERGTVYVTSAIFETGKQSTHWRRSESSDVFAGNKIEAWNPNQPMNTGIQSAHLADGSVRASKILPNAIYDYHISNYARIQEHKLELNYPTHNHPNKAFLDSLSGFAGTSGNYGTGNTVARGDHIHDDRYLSINGGRVTSTLNTSAIYTSGDINVTGNIVITGNVDGVKVSTLNSSFNTLSGNVNAHIGSGGSAHAVAISGGANGFIDGASYAKLLNIQSNAINQATADTRYLQLTGGALSGSLSVTGNITSTGTYNGINVVTLNTTVTNHIGSGNTAHPVAISGGVAGFIDGASYAKLLNIQANAINQATADGRYYIQNQSVKVSTDNVFIGADTGVQRMGIVKKSGLAPALAVASGNSLNLYEMNTTDLSSNISGTAIMNTVMALSSSSFTYMGNNVWHAGNLVNPATQAWVSGNYYNTATVDSKVASRGDVFQANANTFTSANTFTNAGLSIKIQPSSSLSNATKLLQLNNTTGSELFSVNYSGGVNIAGDLNVTGVQKFSGTTTVSGDYTVSGNMFVSGNTTLGGVTTDTTTVNGTLVVNGNIQQVGYYQQVHRRPLWGIAGDLEFQTNDTSFDNIVYNYDPTIYGMPTVQTGATRYYRLYVIYSDDISSPQASGGQQSTLMYSGNSTMSWNLPLTWGDPTSRRDWYTPYFTGLPTGHATLYAKLAQAGNNLGVRWIELVAYDKF